MRPRSTSATSSGSSRLRRSSSWLTSLRHKRTPSGNGNPPSSWTTSPSSPHRDANSYGVDENDSSTAIPSGAPQHHSAQVGEGSPTAGTTDSPRTAAESGSSGLAIPNTSPGGSGAPGSPTMVTSPVAKSPTTPVRGPTSPSSPSAHLAVPHQIGRPRSPVPEFPPLPAAPPPKVFGMGYSGSRRVPKVQDYAGIKEKHDQQAEEYGRILQEREEAMRNNAELASGSVSPASVERANTVDQSGDKKADTGADEKARLMEQMNANQEKPTERFKKRNKGERRVRDPITGRAIIVKDADPKDFDSSHTRIMGTNVLYHDFPPPAPKGMTDILEYIESAEKLVAAGFVVLWILVSWGSTFWGFCFRSAVVTCSGIAVTSFMSLNRKNMEKEIMAVRQDQHRTRGNAMVPPTPESVEWLNHLVQLVWGLVDSTMFIPLADTVEDILQQSLPGFVDSVRITDISQGANALRITSIRALPDQPGDKGYPKTDWIDDGENLKLKDTTGKEIEEDQAGDYYNFEASFAYSALPGQKDRSKNIHMLIQFFLGMNDWFHIPLPIWIQVEQIFGVIRLRVQFIPDPPFVRNVTFALCGVPAVEVSAIPMSRRLPNVLDLPFISSFVKDGIAAGTAELSVPKSMTLNIKEMLSGAVGDTHNIGVFLISVHYCVGLSAQDSNGFSDPYIVLAYAKYGRPLYSTRIILQDLNPVYEETAFLLVSMDEVRSKEDLVAMLWDSDNMSADDLVGRVQIPIEELMSKPNQMYRREDSLKGFEDGNEMPGKLVWSIGYFDRVPLEKKYERLPTIEESKAQPAPVSAPSKEMLPSDAAPNPARDFLPPEPPTLDKTRPDPEWTSGILSIILHQVTNLERQNLEGKSGKDREGEAGQDTDDPSEQTQNLPSGYGEFIVNDALVYRTRVKQYSVNPYFEAGTEVFVRDFRTTEVRVVIRDSRLRESDPILGIVTVDLMDVFSDCSSIKKMYPIQEGVGFGKASISFAFRGVKASLPENMRGWETGTLNISRVRLRGDPAKRDVWEAREVTLRVETNESAERMSKREAQEDGGEIVWDGEPLNLPIYNRYQAHVRFKFGSTGLGKVIGKGKPEAIAILWLQDLTDLMDAEVELPVLVSDDMKQLQQNLINDETFKTHKFEIVGFITARMEFSPGLDLYHENLRLSQGRRHAFQAWMAVEGESEIAFRQQAFDDDGVIDRSERREMKKLHRRQLESRGRGMAQVGAYRSAKWIGRGVMDRLPGKKKTREPTILTEA
ncbi:hypothetical protein CcaverHIS002_0103830 [Cutaneotrichosporon cavernicola]|uniref:C2 domain-containing protein n=1 Tax=Cutaneotrichosporon cavernicola TaxID=279322 RepID=A0AA48IDC1_9TREE|nr:uncharacterized protein CcaverHIS019_0103760 [Cutaneotrichosporon cavernicola]BEI79854.1 hypothetical protein CcaverHIS002_0103830 [Cutaneotrichosporon cavernicola]BEI87658.1 hypothetical protein CcaverHIS019_0103760 [Cutaneotrichosporon cavernicola]BEI95430.1 hypothetical protein CcaverHIS631_0103790 [Cutaneotrichosporon cavernicola]BEJ03204.1 hypothetical protein CcaverHIS641_0103790 [Cutaneotrichosporon cavernicola]